MRGEKGTPDQRQLSRKGKDALCQPDNDADSSFSPLQKRRKKKRCLFKGTRAEGEKKQALSRGVGLELRLITQKKKKGGETTCLAMVEGKKKGKRGNDSMVQASTHSRPSRYS